MDKVIMLITHLHGIKDTVESGDDCLIILITKPILANLVEPRCPKLIKIDQKLGFVFKKTFMVKAINLPTVSYSIVSMQGMERVGNFLNQARLGDSWEAHKLPS